MVFDRDGLSARIPAPEPRAGPSADKVASLVESWFHFSAMPETILWRDDWLLAAEHLHFLRGLVYQLFVEANQPLPPMGLKQWSAKLNPEQRTTLAALPTVACTPDELVHAQLACSMAFLPVARHLATSLGAGWPSELEAAATEHLRQVLGVTDPYGVGEWDR